jgi:ABC-type multidrug transport system fused ATPase/permease subunit
VRGIVFFTLSSWQLAFVLAGILFGATILGLVVGRALRRHSETLREPFGVVQGALLTLVGLILAFGLAMAVTRYEARRAAVVNDANAIGTAYLRAQTLAEPGRSEALPLYMRYTEASLRLSHAIPGSTAAKDAIASGAAVQRQLWRLAGDALDSQATESAPRLYVESLNNMIDMQTTRVSALNNRVPGTIVSIQVIGAAAALFLLALYLALLSRGVVTVLLAAGLLTLLLFVTFDLDRPTRGLITIPDAPLVQLRASMELPPAANAPTP